jgi:Holliday junction DNA helicase RuvB
VSTTATLRPAPTGNTDSLRPTSLDEYIGQERMKRRLMVRIQAAVNEIRPLGHILLCAPPGAGKTSLARLIADLLGDEPFRAMNMPVRESALRDAITEHRGLLFLDEVHALPAKTQELLLPVLEFGELHLPSGEIIRNEWLTIVAATTERHMVLPALYRRFEFSPQYEPYTVNECAAIAASMASKAGINLSPEILDAIGLAAGGAPHAVGKMVKAASSLVSVYEGEPSIGEILDLCGTSADGLTDSHMEYLTALLKLKGTAGQDRIASMIGFKASICTELERLLLDRGFITFGGKGRELTAAGRRRITTA